MSKHDLVLATGMSPYTMTKMRRDAPVALSVPDKVCHTLGYNYGDMMDDVPDEERVSGRDR